MRTQPYHLKRFIILFALVLVEIVYQPLLAQAQKGTQSISDDKYSSYVSPSPVIGWDSLRAKLKYPEIARRAGVEGFVKVRVGFDSSGKIRQIENTIGNAGMEISFLFETVAELLRSESWHPALKNDQPVEASEVFQFLFYIGELTPILIHTDRVRGRFVSGPVIRLWTDSTTVSIDSTNQKK